MSAHIYGPMQIRPIVNKVPPQTSIGDLLHDLLPTLVSDSPILIQAGTGAGKTRAILDELVPYAVDHGQKILFISSRAAISAQFKTNLARAVGQECILTDYTPEGLRKLEEIGPVQVQTFHALWCKLKSHTIDLQTFDYMVWDEIHALALDSTFVPYTGELLKWVIRAAEGIRRIYLSATPEPILDKLTEWGGLPPLTVYQWKTRYDQFLLHFYNNFKDLVHRFRAMPGEEHALIFVSSIREGEALLKLLPGSQLLTSKTRTNDSSKWQQLLTTQTLPARITVATTTLDAGVSLTDPQLKHIVCESLDFAQIVQEAGRKRLKSGEKLNLYLKDPTRQQLGNRLKRVSETLENLGECEKNQNTFVRRFILGEEQPELRSMCLSHKQLAYPWDETLKILYGNPRFFMKFDVNPLAIEYLQQQVSLYSALLASKDERPFEKYICKCFGQPLPTDSSRWLDGRFDTANRDKFWKFIVENSGKTFSEKDDQEKFSSEFKASYTAAYGPRKGDRSDRGWGASIIKGVLAQHNRGYKLQTDKKGWRLVDSRQQSA